MGGVRRCGLCILFLLSAKGFQIQQLRRSTAIRSSVRGRRSAATIIRNKVVSEIDAEIARCNGAIGAADKKVAAADAKCAQLRERLTVLQDELEEMKIGGLTARAEARKLASDLRSLQFQRAGAERAAQVEEQRTAAAAERGAMAAGKQRPAPVTSTKGQKYVPDGLTQSEYDAVRAADRAATAGKDYGRWGSRQGGDSGPAAGDVFSRPTLWTDPSRYFRETNDQQPPVEVQSDRSRPRVRVDPPASVNSASATKSPAVTESGKAEGPPRGEEAQATGGLGDFFNKVIEDSALYSPTRPVRRTASADALGDPLPAETTDSTGDSAEREDGETGGLAGFFNKVIEDSAMYSPARPVRAKVASADALGESTNTSTDTVAGGNERRAIRSRSGSPPQRTQRNAAPPTRKPTETADEVYESLAQIEARLREEQKAELKTIEERLRNEFVEVRSAEKQPAADAPVAQRQPDGELDELPEPGDLQVAELSDLQVAESALIAVSDTPAAGRNEIMSVGNESMEGTVYLVVICPGNSTYAPDEATVSPRSLLRLEFRRATLPPLEALLGGPTMRDKQRAALPAPISLSGLRDVGWAGIALSDTNSSTNATVNAVTGSSVDSAPTRLQLTFATPPLNATTVGTDATTGDEPDDGLTLIELCFRSSDGAAAAAVALRALADAQTASIDDTSTKKNDDKAAGGDISPVDAFSSFFEYSPARPVRKKSVAE